MTRSAHRDPRLTATVVERRPLATPHGHVRAASGLVALADAWVVVQDDALAFAWGADPGALRAVPIPVTGEYAAAVHRGEKKYKLDLEAAIAWQGGVVAFGSGSTARRERLAVWAAGADSVALVDAPALYRRLAEALGTTPNLEGALAGPDGLRLFHRGNGVGGWNAALDLPLAALPAALAGAEHPEAPRVTRWALGALDGVPLGFTDATAGAGDAWFFSAAAENTDDAVADGPVAGSVIGWSDAREAAWAPLTDADGRILADKVEGLAFRGGHLFAVTDADAPDRPAELLTLRLAGPWPGPPAGTPDSQHPTG